MAFGTWQLRVGRQNETSADSGTEILHRYPMLVAIQLLLVSNTGPTSEAKHISYFGKKIRMRGQYKKVSRTSGR